MKKATKSKATSDYPVLSPLSSQAKTAGSDRKVSKARRNRVVSSSEEESEVEIEDVLKPQPFPMSTQVLGSIGFPCTPPIAGPSRPGKRSSSERNSTDGEREKKKTRKDDDMCVYLLSLLLHLV